MCSKVKSFAHVLTFFEKDFLVFENYCRNMFKTLKFSTSFEHVFEHVKALLLGHFRQFCTNN